MEIGEGQPRRWITSAVNMSVAVVVILSAWTVNAEFFHVGGVTLKSKGNAVIAFDLSPERLGLAEWAVGSVIYKEDQGAYQATVVDAERRERFRILIDGKTGEPVAKREKTVSNPMPVKKAIRSVEDIIGALTVGNIIRKQGKPFAQVDLLHNGLVVSKIKIHPKTGRPYDPNGVKKENQKKGMKKIRILPPGPATFTGWMGTVLGLGGTFYLIWRGSALRPFIGRAAEGGQARKVFNRTLAIHCRVSFIALALIVLHSANGLMKIQWSTSWLAMAAILITSGSGIVGSSFIRTPPARQLWLRFQRPVAIVLFLLTVFHAAHKLEFM